MTVDEDLPAPRPMRRRSVVVLSALAVAGIAAGGAYAYAATGSGSASPAAAAPSASSSTSTAKCPAAPTPGNDFDGLITAVDSSSLSVRNLFGTSRTYALGSSTTVHEGMGQTVKVSSLSTGERVHVRGSKSASRYQATDIDVHPASIDGRVTALSSSAFTVVDADGFTRTVSTDSGTTYSASGKSASRSAITSGSVVHAQGKVDSDGTSLDADSVAKVTEGSGPAVRPGGMRMDRRGMRGGPPAPGCGPAGGPGRDGRGPGHGMPNPPSGTPSRPAPSSS
jgi:hypothetical protein